ncbi:MULTISPECIES: MerR family transcriptional regulator [Caballeronia]|uniref:HTH merR-type domain-containing protein n=1 Tax=Caballeronia zhejiangensis TaxID=871203 RepID=A0A656QQU4_9BURK|nr:MULTISPECIES: MerR family transcriptional regulator [Caballeronia]EKS67883.1 hypothetical protein BURK_022665 [Burkholderia sp. SJ98]KDR31764.1 hypothetical protein BG60_28960 [Caballeronia zhejiangensis]
MSFPSPRNSAFAPLDKQEHTHANTPAASPVAVPDKPAAAQSIETDPNRVLSIGEVAKLLGLSTRTLKLWEKTDPCFPKSFQMGTRARNWLYEDVQAYILEKAGRRKA